MVRENTVRLSDEEKQKLNRERLRIFGTDEVPYGAVISELCDNE